MGSRSQMQVLHMSCSFSCLLKTHILFYHSSSFKANMDHMLDETSWIPQNKNSIGYYYFGKNELKTGTNIKSRIHNLTPNLNNYFEITLRLKKKVHFWEVWKMVRILKPIVMIKDINRIKFISEQFLFCFFLKKE